MNRQQITRRLVLGAFTVALALPGFGAAAAGEDFADDIASGAQMKGICEDFGGIFTDTQDGNLWCQWDDGSQTVCDEDGKDCHDIPRTQLPVGPWDSPVGTGGEWTTDGGGTETPTPVVDSTSPPAPVIDSVAPAASVADSPRVAAPDDDQDQDTSRAKKSKKGKKGGKGRKK